jgi:protein gp37
MNEVGAIAWLSMEPLLGPVDLWGARYALPGGGLGNAFSWGGGISLAIVGGESGNGARPMVLRWARDILRDCRGSAAFWMKQLGGVRDKRDRIEEWPEDLQVQEMPR